MLPSTPRRRSTDRLPSSQSGHALGSLLNVWEVHGKQWHKAAGVWGWNLTPLPTSLASLTVKALLQFVPGMMLAGREQPVYFQY